MGRRRLFCDDRDKIEAGSNADAAQPRLIWGADGAAES